MMGGRPHVLRTLRTSPDVPSDIRQETMAALYGGYKAEWRLSIFFKKSSFFPQQT